MATIISFLKGQSAFEPEATQAMSVAFDDACQILRLNGDERAREAVATRIIELARRGERDPARLRDAVLHDAGGSRPA
jgi:hypothetical protein